MTVKLPYHPKQDPAPKTALMVFSLSAELDGRRKRLFRIGRHSQATAVFQWLVSRTAFLAEASGLDVAWVDENKQQGGNFAERFTGALAARFAEGYDQVIAIGNDSPGLNLEILQQAMIALQENTLVLGPARDGGDYLIGINRHDFSEAAFLKLPWNTADLHRQLVLTAEKEGRHIVCLSALTDIDDGRSLRSYLREYAESDFSCFVICLLHGPQRPHFRTRPQPGSLQLRSGHRLRGPPPFYHYTRLV